MVLMDELDQLVTKNQGVMYNYQLAHAPAVLSCWLSQIPWTCRADPEQQGSRLGADFRSNRNTVCALLTAHRQVWPAHRTRYNHDGGEDRPVASRRACRTRRADAIEFASRKVAAVSGDTRRALDIAGGRSSSPSEARGRRRRGVRRPNDAEQAGRAAAAQDDGEDKRDHRQEEGRTGPGDDRHGQRAIGLYDSAQAPARAALRVAHVPRGARLASSAGLAGGTCGGVLEMRRMLGRRPAPAATARRRKLLGGGHHRLGTAESGHGGMLTVSARGSGGGPGPR